ncbi:uncharacterized protein C9orf153 homolog [Pipistrellus kuhlii]|uniref:Uncharacterized protein n=1 Tax=Pipistrellus kuhlii TaxID=59472 RepID=A0A7J7W294_PIPKU|nr:uncharacterized protein C9orf153 homolog [Pipistrellus kuhlii]KAF6331529.1 hypothetical protein mPipKuh1_001907 [Pipistrellus kuhlii]
MFTTRDDDPSTDDVEAEFPRCSLPELYALAENVNKESKKSNRLKTLGLSPTEARRILTQILTITGRTDSGEDSQPVLKDKEVKRKEEKPPSLTDLLHHSLLTGSPSHIGRLGESKQRLAQYGIPPPMHTFPFEVIITDTNLSGTTQKRLVSTGKVPRISISKVKTDKLLFEDRITEYSIIEPEKQFLDLRDLEWKYYKGITKWKHKTSDAFAKIQYNSEKRFVENKETPTIVFPSLIRRSLVIYPQVNFPPNLTL